MIITGSRYSESSETRNDKTVSVALPTTFSTNNYFTIVATGVETFELLAYRYLNDASMWWKIADINKNITFPDYITAGTTVRIPFV